MSKFNPDKETGGLTNGFRALCAEEAMDCHESQKGGIPSEEIESEPFAERLTDLLADLMHLCHEQGESFTWATMTAREHFESESK